MISRVPLTNTEFEGENNVYLLQDGEQTALIDTGYTTTEVRSQLEAGLAEHGVSFEDMTDIFVTHWHHDHAGLASVIQQASGAPIYAPKADAELIRQDQTAWQEYESLLRESFDEWGMPDEKRTELLDILDLDGSRLGPEPTDVRTFGDGEIFTVGSAMLEAMHLPGHTDGLSGFAVEGKDGGEELFSSDAILPQYTPNVGGADLRVTDPLEKYLVSLHRVIDRGFTKAWPGHRDPIADPAGRAREIITHHNDRTERVFDAVRDHGPIDTWSISTELFGSLSSIHIIHGPGEAHAHLAHLLNHGLVEETANGYVCPDPNASLESVFSPVES